MGGFTPFQFSSRKLMQSTLSIAKMDFNENNVLKDAFLTVFAWYEMWINPEKLTMQTEFIQNMRHTAASIVTFHYRKNPIRMDVSGVCGWVEIQSEVDKLKNAAVQSLLKMDASKLQGAAKDAGGVLKTAVTKPLSPIGGKTNAGTRRHTNNLDNSPRKFLERLRDIAYEPMYYIDEKGFEHYNTKYIKIFTKQYPDGLICEGYYTNFSVEETGEDAQTINYSFSFVIENYKPVTLIQRVLGMFTGVGQAAGSLARGIPI